MSGALRPQRTVGCMNMSAHAGDERLGPYCLRKQLGVGGMGVVYLADDAGGRPVAIKVLRQGLTAEETARRRLAHEVATMRRVSSPYVAEVVDADLTGNPPYIVTRYVPGETLEDVVAANVPLSGGALASLASGLTAALTAVHAAGVVHRDLKPGNVMLVDGRPVVIDFGIAQAADSTRLTMTGMFMGTPGYLAPEVIEGRPSGPAADIHSWGATVAFAATGRPPFGTGSFEAIFYRIVHGQPDLSGTPTPLVPLVLASLARDPSRRPSAADLAGSLAGLNPAGLVPGPAGQPVLRPDAQQAAQLPLAPDHAAAPHTSPDLEWSQVSTMSAKHPAVGAAGKAMPGTPVLPGAAGALPGAAGAAAAGAAAAGAAAAAAANGNGSGAAPGAMAGAAPAPAGAWPGTMPFTARRRDDFADLLPPVDYSALAARPAGAGMLGPGPYPAGPHPAGPGMPAGAVPGHGPAPYGARQTAGAGQRPARLPLVLATVVGFVAVSVLMPIAGAAIVLLILILLRSADVTTMWRSRHLTSVAAAVAYFPWAVFRSVVRFILLAPLALLCAGGAAAIAVLADGSSVLPKAGGWAAGALVACYCLGPGSAACRRPLSRFYGSITRSAFGAMAGFAGLAAVAAVAVAAAAALAPGYWPAAHLGQQLQTASVGHSFLGQLPSNLTRVGRQFLNWAGHRL
jgi:Protein kinase domain